MINEASSHQLNSFSPQVNVLQQTDSSPECAEIGSNKLMDEFAAEWS